MKVPFFIKGLIRGGLADDYEGKLPLNQAGALFIRDVAGFADEAGVALDGQPTVILVAPDGRLLQAFKGEVSEPALSEVKTAVDSAIR